MIILVYKYAVFHGCGLADSVTKEVAAVVTLRRASPHN